MEADILRVTQHFSPGLHRSFIKTLELVMTTGELLLFMVCELAKLTVFNVTNRNQSQITVKSQIQEGH